MMKRLIVTVMGIALCFSASAVERYVDLNNSAPVAPYTNWASAATDIQTAVDAASAGDTVWVTNGTYYLTSEITVSSDVTIRSANGPDATVVDAQWYSRCLTISADNVSIDGFTLCNGWASIGGGGAMYVGGADCSISNCVIRDNVAFFGGGGVYGDSPSVSLSLKNCILRNNESLLEGGGGAERINSAYNCLFEGNRSDGGGGGLREAQIVSGCIFKDNVAGGNGGGIEYAEEAINCRFEGNSAGGDGGGMWLGGAFGCLFVSNSASGNGGGGYACVSANCTVTENHAGISGGGIYDVGRYNDGGFDGLFNSIVYNNTPDDAAGITEWTWIFYSCSPDFTHGDFGNITNAPAFGDAGAGDYRLSTSSPCVDMGINAYSPGPADLDNNPRIMNSRIDMGAYEYQGAITDTDGDGIGDFAESLYGTDPAKPDSDGDGFDDGWEVAQGWNPTQYNADVVSYIDSNPSVFGGFTEEDIGDLAFGQVMLGVSNSMVNLKLDIMQSDDLINWTNVGQAVQWSIPETNKSFFRFRAQP